MEPPPSVPADEEDSIIAAILRARPSDARPHHAPPRLGNGDDAAVTADGTALTVDTLVQGVHWDDRLSAADVGYKSLAVSVSDLIAVGASPRWALLSLALPHAQLEWAADFARGLHEACDAFRVDLLGGDTVRTSGPAVVTLTAGGTCDHAPLTRRNAQPGDTIWVTGTLGLAGAGWSTAAPSARALAALRRPTPPVDFAFALHTQGLATAGMDLSDGLARDLPRLCAASQVGAHIDVDALPHDHDTPIALCLTGGEDYQLLFTSSAAAQVILDLGAAHHTTVTPIGTINGSQQPTLSRGAWPKPSFTHFAPEQAAS